MLSSKVCDSLCLVFRCLRSLEPVRNRMTPSDKSWICERFVIRESILRAFGYGECYQPKASGLIVTLFPTLSEHELRIPKSLRRSGLRLQLDIRYCYLGQGFISQCYEDIPLPLQFLLPSTSFPITATTHKRPHRRHQLRLLQHGLTRQRAPAAIMLDSMRLPKTRHGRRRIPQIHQRSARTPRERPNGEIRHGPLVNGTTFIAATTT